MSDIAMIEAAAERLRGHARRTPLLGSPFLDALAGRRVLVKAECLQHAGAFKYRGARAAISALAPEVRARGVLAYSSGNHAQGIALVAWEYSVPAVIVMPADAPRLKLDNTRGLGAEVVTYMRGKESREDVGGALAEARGLTLIRPFDDPQVIAGQGTVGLEIAEDAAAMGIDEAEVLTCCGGGGLTAGVALALAARAPGMQVRPVEPEGFDDVARSLRAGKILSNPSEQGSLCDAVLTPAPGQLTFPILAAHCGPGLTVSDKEALRAVALAFLRLKIAVEPGGAVALAAALWRGEALQTDTVIVTASGGNMDPDLLARALREL